MTCTRKMKTLDMIWSCEREKLVAVVSLDLSINATFDTYLYVEMIAPLKGHVNVDTIETKSSM